MAQAEITFVTGNTDKLRTANIIGRQFDVVFKQAVHDIIEIQSEDASVIALDKAQKAYELIKVPLVVNDDSWAISGLKGFPGPYMKSMTHWLSPEDFLRLTKDLADRRVTLRQYSVYQDKRGQQLFQQNIEGILLPEIRGLHATSPLMPLVSFDDGKTSVAENHANGQASIDGYRTTWHDLCEWLAKGQS